MKSQADLRFAAARFALVMDEETRDVATSPSKFNDVKQAAAAFMMACTPLLGLAEEQLSSDAAVLDLKGIADTTKRFLAESIDTLIKDQVFAIDTGDKELRDLVPENWRAHVVDVPNESWIDEHMLAPNLATKISDVWARSFAVFRNVKDSETILDHAMSERHMQKLSDFEKLLAEGKTVVASCVFCKTIYVKMRVSPDKKQLAKDTRRKLQTMEANPPVELLKRLSHASTQ